MYLANVKPSMDQVSTITLYQPLLHSIAMKFVRCKADAEDIVQETYLKWLSLGPQKVENIKAYLVRAVTNNCLNHLNTLKQKKEELFSSVNMQEIIHRFRETNLNLAHLDLEVHLADAMKVILAKLEPLERAVYLLKEVFGFDYDSLQETLDKKKEHCRQLLCRAKKKLQTQNLKINLELADTSGLLESFKKACHFGNAAELISELKKDIGGTIEKQP